MTFSLADGDAAPALTCYSPDGCSEEEWDKLVHQVDTRVRRAISNTLTSFIQNLYISENYIRLGVDFGSLKLRSFQRLQNESGSCQTDDFLVMIQNRRTQLSDCDLQADDGSLFHLVEIIENMPEFYQQEKTFITMFDFSNATGTSCVRLQTERVEGYDTMDTEIRGQRWLDLHNNVESATVLNLKILDLTKPSFVIRASNHDLLKDSHITKEMRTFQNVHGFMPDSREFKTYPKKRSVIPPGQKDLMTVTEVTSVKTRVRGMEGTLEIQRHHVYDYRDGKDSPWPVSSKWTASYYYLGWDNRLDEFSNTQPGEEVSWSRSLSTFFPEQATEDEVLALPMGFKKFWEELKVIQGHLKEALERIAYDQDCV